MEQTATTNSTRRKKSRESPEELRAVSVLQTTLQQLRDELATARTALDGERAALRALRRDRVAEMNAARREEAEKWRNTLNDLKSRYGIFVAGRTKIGNKQLFSLLLS
jgi:hypothetical protein